MIESGRLLSISQRGATDDTREVYLDLEPITRRRYAEIGVDFDALDENGQCLAMRGTAVHLCRSLPAPQDELEMTIGSEAYDAAITEADRWNELAGRSIEDGHEEVAQLAESFRRSIAVSRFLDDHADELTEYAEERYRCIGEKATEGNVHVKEMSCALYRMRDSVSFRDGLKTYLGEQCFYEVQAELSRFDKMETLRGSL